MKYRFLAPALSEASKAADFYESEVAGLGGEFIDELDAALVRLLQFPDAWGRISENYRHCNLRRFPYTIIYTVERGDEVLVVSVFHQSREPLSWRRNL